MTKIAFIGLGNMGSVALSMYTISETPFRGRVDQAKRIHQKKLHSLYGRFALFFLVHCAGEPPA